MCTELGFCNSSQSVSKQPKTEVSLKNSVGCVLCQFVMDKLASLITEKSTEVRCNRECCTKLTVIYMLPRFYWFKNKPNKERLCTTF